MRVISGLYKGRKLKSSKGYKTRPTTDRVKEGMFSSLISIEQSFSNKNILDMYAGSGALGIEALSRGAKFCTFFDISKIALNNVSYNLNSLNISKNSYILHCCNVDYIRDWSLYINDKLDVVFLDPPYATSAYTLQQNLENLKPHLNRDAIIVYEHDKLNSCLSEASYNIVSKKTYGQTIIDFYKVK